MHIVLIRFAYTTEATLGWLDVGDMRFATLEEPWIANRNGPGGCRRRDGKESCVPDGVYSLKPHSGTNFKQVWRLSNPKLGVYDTAAEIPDVSKCGRATCLIHSGNSTKDIEGCILVGRRHGRESNMPWVYESRNALEDLRTRLSTDGIHKLEIRPSFGTEE